MLAENYREPRLATRSVLNRVRDDWHIHRERRPQMSSAKAILGRAFTWEQTPYKIVAEATEGICLADLLFRH